MENSETPTFQILQSDEFKDEFLPNSIRIDVLLSFALLHCHNEQGASAKVFYQVLQSGGVSSQATISHDDKDFKPVFETMCKLASTHIIHYYEAFGEGRDAYTKAERKTIEEAIKEVHTEWIELVFDVDCKLVALDWMKKVDSAECNWIFNPKAIRERLFEHAEPELEWRY